MNRYTFKFYGRTAGALGIGSWHTRTVEADTKEAGELRLYETHDHLMQVRLVDFEGDSNATDD